MSELLADRGGAQVYHASWQELLDVVPRCDALIVDCPYSERTHTAHDDGAMTANRAAEFSHRAADAGPPNDSIRAARLRYEARGRGQRNKLNYAFWTSTDVDAFVDAWSARVDGWIVSLTDHVLAPHWEVALRRAGRHSFSPLACVEPGSRVRMVGDGPAQWSCFAVVGRPKTLAFSKWGALPGAYVVPPGHNPRAQNGGKGVTGGKPQWLMERLVEDYSRPGQLVVDPCCGAGTTITAAIRTGRRAIGGDMMREHAELAAASVLCPQQLPLLVAS